MTKKIISRQQTNRTYVRSNRQVWANLGFRNTTVLVSDDDRNKLNAIAAVMRHEKMLSMAEDDSTNFGLIVELSRRNMATVVEKGDLDELETKAKSYENQLELSHMIDEVRKLKRRYSGFESAYNDAGSDTIDRITAKIVACANLMAAKVSYINAVMEQSPLAGTDPKEIFGEVEIET